VTAIRAEGGAWKARTHSLAPNHDVHIVHYWDQFKPWAIHCPIYQSYAGVEDALQRIE
jgi:hypothetical protein